MQRVGRDILDYTAGRRINSPEDSGWGKCDWGMD